MLVLIISIKYREANNYYKQANPFPCLINNKKIDSFSDTKRNNISLKKKPKNFILNLDIDSYDDNRKDIFYFFNEENIKDTKDKTLKTFRKDYYNKKVDITLKLEIILKKLFGEANNIKIKRDKNFIEKGINPERDYSERGDGGIFYGNKFNNAIKRIDTDVKLILNKTFFKNKYKNKNLKINDNINNTVNINLILPII